MPRTETTFSKPESNERMSTPFARDELARSARVAVLLAAFLGLVFDGFELGLMPVAAPSVTKSLLGPDVINTLSAQELKETIGHWFALYTASLMLGAAFGGIFLGNLGDRIGRARAMGVSILFYSVFALAGAFAKSQEQMLALRFAVGLGVGGMWPNGVALVAECWQNTSRPTVSGILGAGINVGILVLSIIGSRYPIAPDSWRWVFALSSISVLLGLTVVLLLPESPKWLASRGQCKTHSVPLRDLIRGDLMWPTMVAIALCSVPLIGAWAGSKWMIPWADSVGGIKDPGYKSTTQFYWALGATLGGLIGAPLSARLGKRTSYFAISLGATAITWTMFRWTEPFAHNFLSIVFVQGLVATLFFGWLPLFLPELFPVRIRATATGIAMNVGRFVTAGGVLAAGWLVALFDGDYSSVGAACALIYALGMIVAFTIPKPAAESA
jgi:SHS family sialic acid transporter-like MFS transporter